MSVLVVGSINIDDAIRVARLPEPGETVSATSITTALGGKGANQAVAAARAGARVRMLGAVGADGDEVLGALSRSGVDVSAVERVTDGTGRAVVLIDDRAENSIVVVPGANASVPEAAVIAECSSLSPGDVLLLQHEIPPAVSIAAAAAARSAGATVVWNAAPAPVATGELVRDVDLLVVNEHELAAVAELLDVAGERLETNLAAVAAALHADVVCTLGAEGALFTVGGDVGRRPARAVDAVDTTAAGDTFVGYLAATAGTPFDERLRIALTAASLAVTAPGAAESIPTRADVDRASAEPGRSAS